MEKMTIEQIEALPREYISAKEAAVVLGISCAMFYKCAGKMPFPVLRLGKNYRIPKRPFVTFIRTGIVVKNWQRAARIMPKKGIKHVELNQV